MLKTYLKNLINQIQALPEGESFNEKKKIKLLKMKTSGLNLDKANDETLAFLFDLWQEDFNNIKGIVTPKIIH